MSNLVKIGVLLFIAIFLIKNGLQTQQNKRITGDWDRTTSVIKNYTGADQFLDSLHIPKDAKILALDVSAPNIPFILMNRKGYSQMKNNYYTLKTMLSWDVDYVVYENEFFMSSIYHTYPSIINQLTKIADNGKISVCVKNKTTKSVSLAEFIGIDSKKPAFEESIDFESEINSNWTNVNIHSDLVFKGKSAYRLDENEEFGITFKSNGMDVLKKSGTILAFEAFMNYNSKKNFDLIVSITENGATKYYKSVDLAPILEKQNQWQKVNLLFYLPKVESNEYEFALYLLNKDKSELLIDDLKFEIYN